LTITHKVQNGFPGAEASLVMLSVVFIDNPATSALKEKEAPYRTPSVAEAQFHSSVLSSAAFPRLGDALNILDHLSTYLYQDGFCRWFAP
jgi:hypothetical protein